MSFDIRGRNPRRGAYYVSRGYRYHGGRRVAPRSLYGRLYRVVLLDRAERAIDTKRPLNSIGICREPIRRNFGRAQDAGTEIREESAAVLAVPLADPPRDDGLAGARERQERILIAELSGIGWLQMALLFRDE